MLDMGFEVSAFSGVCKTLALVFVSNASTIFPNRSPKFVALWRNLECRTVMNVKL